MKRRNFTKKAGLGILGLYSLPSFIADELTGNLPNELPKVPLGLCNHSLRGLRLNVQQLIEFAIGQKLDSVLLNTFQPFKSLNSEHLAFLKKKAQDNGIRLYIGAGSISEKSVKFSDKYGSAKDLLQEGIRVASSVGSPIVGCRIGSIEDRYVEGGIKVHVDAVIKLMKSLRHQALDAGVKFAFENHAGDLRSSELLALIQETGTDICGALYDPANAVWAMEDPMEALKTLGSNIICTSVRDVHVWETDDGAVFQGDAIGQGMLDYREIASFMAEKCQGVPLNVETISNSNRPVPFLKSEFWEGFPDLSAADIVSFLKLIKRGKPNEILKPPGDMDRKTFDIEFQQLELIDSLNYLRKYCNAGLKS